MNRPQRKKNCDIVLLWYEYGHDDDAEDDSGRMETSSEVPQSNVQWKNEMQVAFTTTELSVFFFFSVFISHSQWIFTIPIEMVLQMWIAPEQLKNNGNVHEALACTQPHNRKQINKNDVKLCITCGCCCCRVFAYAIFILEL